MSDFLDFKYEKLEELSKTVKSPYLADWKGELILTNN